MTNTIIDNTPLREIINGLNTGLYEYNDLTNIRIFNKLKPEYIIIPVEADISEAVFDFVDKDLESKQFENKNIEIDTTVLDFIVVSKNLSEGKYKIVSMSIFELLIATTELENIDNEWDFDKPNFLCTEINYTELTTEVKTDMNILG